MQEKNKQETEPPKKVMAKLKIQYNPKFRLGRRARMFRLASLTKGICDFTTANSEVGHALWIFPNSSEDNFWKYSTKMQATLAVTIRNLLAIIHLTSLSTLLISNSMAQHQLSGPRHDEHLHWNHYLTKKTAKSSHTMLLAAYLRLPLCTRRIVGRVQIVWFEHDSNLWRTNCT